jgi:hypothetical protein
MRTITFNNAGTFAANYAAEDFARSCGFSVGSMQRGAPRGILYGDYLISKWRNMSRKEILALHGVMEGDFREGPVTIRLYDHAPAEAVAKFDEMAKAQP